MKKKKGVGREDIVGKIPVKAKTIPKMTETTAENEKRKLKKLPRTMLLRNFVLYILYSLIVS